MTVIVARAPTQKLDNPKLRSLQIHPESACQQCSAKRNDANSRVPIGACISPAHACKTINLASSHIIFTSDNRSIERKSMYGMIMAPDRGRNERLFELGVSAIGVCPSRSASLNTLLTDWQLVAMFLLGRHLISKMSEVSDPDHEKKEQTRIKSAAILRRLDAPDDTSVHRDNDRPRREELELSQYEQAVLQDLVFPEDISVSFEDIGGLSHVIDELRESVIYPLTMPGLYATSSALLSAPSGVLLYGPPGCVCYRRFSSERC